MCPSAKKCQLFFKFEYKNNEYIFRLTYIVVEMKKKTKIKWNEVVAYIQHELFFSQKDLSVICEVTQQSISNWKQEVRNPGPYAKKQLTRILDKAGVSLDTYRRGYSEHMLESEDVVLQELINIYMSMPLEERNGLLKFARFTKKRK